MEAIEEGGGRVETPTGCLEGHRPVGQDVLIAGARTGGNAGLGKLLHLGDGGRPNEGVWPLGGGSSGPDYLWYRLQTDCRDGSGCVVLVSGRRLEDAVL